MSDAAVPYSARVANAAIRFRCDWARIGVRAQCMPNRGLSPDVAAVRAHPRYGTPSGKRNLKKPLASRGVLASEAAPG